MLPIYKATALVGIIEKGGHTRPWAVTVKTNDGILPYVVKLYTTDQINTRNSVTAEVIANQLAQHFEFNVPPAALIEFDEDFQLRLPVAAQEILGQRDSRVKFGSLLLEPAQLFTPGLPKKTFASRCLPGLDTLFAFDNFVRNADRGHKPNLLFHDKGAWLIDHEKAFDSLATVASEMDGWRQQDFSSYPPRLYQYHICFPYLKRAKKPEKAGMFADFFFYLESLNLDRLAPYFRQLEAADYTTDQANIMAYLQLIQRNSSIFDTLLKILVS